MSSEATSKLFELFDLHDADRLPRFDSETSIESDILERQNLEQNVPIGKCAQTAFSCDKTRMETNPTWTLLQRNCGLLEKKRCGWSRPRGNCSSNPRARPGDLQPLARRCTRLYYLMIKSSSYTSPSTLCNLCYTTLSCPVYPFL